MSSEDDVVEEDITIADARALYIKWNKTQLASMAQYTTDEIYKYIKLIPLFLHLNNKLLPGYSSDFKGLDVTPGVYGYQTDKSAINDAKLLNSKFRYQHEGIIKNAEIDSVFFQRVLINASFVCWVIVRSSLSNEKFEALKTKTEKISSWFLSKNIVIEFVCVLDQDFSSEKTNIKLSGNKAFFLDNFYSESVLLAGKYPVWWLVPSSKENQYNDFVAHIKQARFVDNDEFIDLGSPSEINQDNLLEFSVNQVQVNKLSAEICLVQLLLAEHKGRAWPARDGISFRLKKILYQKKTDPRPLEIMTDIMRETFSYYATNRHIYTSEKLFGRLRETPGRLNPQIIECFLKDKECREETLSGIDNILASLNYFKAVADEIRQLYDHIVDVYVQRKNQEKDQNLLSVAKNLQTFLSESANRVPLYNSKNITGILFDRIMLRFEQSAWSLVLETSPGNEKNIDGFTSLLGLLAWCWLNRVVNQSTQISIDYPSHQVRQIEARHVLEILMSYLDPSIVSSIASDVYEKPAQPLKSLLFVSLLEEDEANKVSGAPLFAVQPPIPRSEEVLHCEQLIINSWGDVYTREFSGNFGVLECLCEWTHQAPLVVASAGAGRSRRSKQLQPQSIQAFSYGTGNSTHIAQRIEQIYFEVIDFFYKNRKYEGRFIVRMDTICYLLRAENTLLAASEIGADKALLTYLQAGVDVYCDTALERLTLTEQPLREIYQRNKKNILQVFYQVKARQYHVWVLDEKGTLWTDTLNVHDRESYPVHWLYLFRNIRNILKNISAESGDVVLLEICQISINQLGEFEFHTKGAEALSGEKQFFELQIKIQAPENEDQLSLVFEDQVFLHSEFGKNALLECIQYMSASMSGGRQRPVFVTNMDIPLNLYHVDRPERLQISHILKFKRNFEHRINKLLQG
ncbi:hypothetical protein MNBD_GAMMA10-1339 [hydrothermal vent metagenome]|uniref:Adenylate cyclase class-I N-terminal domain-containing protein n=1 Tax=hydrothermal vent metagenome TaxID=652676 RepID=A0A3B0YM09_9ZZZZ